MIVTVSNLQMVQNLSMDVDAMASYIRDWTLWVFISAGRLGTNPFQILKRNAF